MIGVVPRPATTPPNGSFVSFGGRCIRVVRWRAVVCGQLVDLRRAATHPSAHRSAFDTLAKYPANGTEVAVANPQFHGEGYVFAGGAPLSVSNWANINSHPQWTMVDGNALSHFTTTEPYDHVLQYPANGTYVAVGNSNEHGAGFVFAGGAPLAIASWSNVSNPKWTIVDGNALDTYSSNDTWHADNHVRQYPANGTAVARSATPPTTAPATSSPAAHLNVAGSSNVGNPRWVVVDSARSTTTTRPTPTSRSTTYTTTPPTARSCTPTPAPPTAPPRRGPRHRELHRHRRLPAPAPTDAWVISNAGQTAVHLLANPANGS